MMKRNIIALMLVVLCHLSVTAKERIKVGDFFYEIDNRSLTASLVNAGELFAPHTYNIDGHLDIPKAVFYNGQKYVVTDIGPYAFYWCSISSVTIPNSVVSIDESAFERSKLLSVKIPNSVKKIGHGAFAFCEKLESVVLPCYITEISGSLFADCKSLASVTIPNGVKKIRDYAFASSGLESVKIPNSVTYIGENVFRFCHYLKKIYGLHAGIEMHDDAFYCNDLKPWFESYKQSFEFMANGFIIDKIKEWQEKRDFETTAQYKQRVTKENQQKKINELIKEAINNYTAKNKLQITLGDYDAEYQMYALNSNYGQKYVKVPLAQASSFKSNFKRATYKASYVPSGDSLIIANLTVNINGRKYVAEKTAVEVASNIDIDLPEIVLASNDTPKESTPKPSTIVDRAIDQNIPSGGVANSNTFAVIIGNERYTQVAHVPFASNDARIFAEYCRKTLGLPARNVKVYENATYGTMIGAVSDIQKIARAFKGDINVIFYYAGHGIPDEATGDGYLLPIDADGMNMRVCYPLSQLYKDLASMQARSVTCFMDACFSGAQRGSGMVVAARGVTIKAKNDHPTGNTVVFTAATDKQTAYPYEEKGHGMFTYYLLKKLRDTKGDCTLGELGTYICDEVAKQAVVTNGKEQTPVVLTSVGVNENWRTMKLK